MLALYRVGVLIGDGQGLEPLAQEAETSVDRREALLALLVFPVLRPVVFGRGDLDRLRHLRAIDLPQPVRFFFEAPVAFGRDVAGFTGFVGSCAAPRDDPT